MRTAARPDRHARSRRGSARACAPAGRRARTRSSGRPVSPRRRAGERAPRRRCASSPGTLLAAPQSREQVLRPRGLRRRPGLAHRSDGGLGRNRPRSGLPLALRTYCRVHLLAVRLVRHRRHIYGAAQRPPAVGSRHMCFELDSEPPIPAISGAAVSHDDVVLEAADGNRFAAFLATPEEPATTGVVILPDVRGLYRFYEELALRFAERGFAAIALDYLGPTAGVEKRGEDFEYTAHVGETTPDAVQADVAAAVSRLRELGCTSIF